ncbi:hypothetical protein OSSY52_02950 [Tepiditoga spiralis]|uniref:Peptidase S8/S53 domain-containing protein n=2 Tax=Tepiditoga spiralis TaxID=2108365 RepID=A0A7G1G557_9BACT|nr:hypothetical protein OSSY52_02950 [Tepiditoga spiralis]
MPIRVLGADGSGSLDNVALGIRYAADHGANIINMSLGGGANAQTLADAVKYAHDKGVTIVTASGNDNGSISYPAKYPETIAVGSVRYDLKRAWYSNYGPELDVVAPGGDTQVDQNNDGYADGVLSTTWKPDTGDTYVFMQGTSMASPHVAGVAALLYAHGIKNPEDIRNVLRNSATDLGDTGYDNYYGAGLINAYNALTYNDNGNGGNGGGSTPPTTAKLKAFVLGYDYWQGGYVVISDTQEVVNGHYQLNEVQTGYTSYVCVWQDNNNNGKIDSGDYWGYDGSYNFKANQNYNVNLTATIKP